jgi:hypothetical protein
METELEQQDKQQQEQPPATKKPKWLSRILGGEVLQSRAVLKQIPLILLLCFYAIMLVYNRYRVEDLTKAKAEAQERVNYLSEARIELQKRYQETIKISQIAELLDSTGVGITAGPPYELKDE